MLIQVMKYILTASIIETTDSLENYPDGIKIYNKEGDLINEN